MPGSESKQTRSLIRVPRLSLLIVLACLLILGTLLFALWTMARSGIRQVQASGGEVSVGWNSVSLFVTDFIWIDRMYLSTDHDVERVDLFGPTVDDDFVKVLHRFPSLQWVLLWDTSVTDKSLVDISGMRSINGLSLFDSPGVTDTGISELAKLPNLKSLSIIGLQIAGSGLGTLTPLESLTIFDCPKLESVEIQSLGRLRNLERLKLNGPAVTDEGLQGINGPPLRALTVNSADITDSSLRFIAEQYPDLTSLNLGDLAHITDTGVQELSALNNLEYLGIHRCGVSPETISDLRHALSGCRVEYESSTNGAPEPARSDAAESSAP